MSCPTCDHTMHCIGHGIFWCPRCGTLKGNDPLGQVSIPALVDRCRRFAAEGNTQSYFLGKSKYDHADEEWRKLGIAESINVPSERPEL